MRDYYKELGINSAASNQQIKKAYREAVLFWHPDRNKSVEANERFIVINEAYSILIDEKKRAVYDKLYANWIKADSDIASSIKSENEDEAFDRWVKDARLKAQKMSNISPDNLLTETFYLIDKYWLGAFVLIMAILSLFALLSKS
jgi:curved DNA-binding protein CbpA